MTRYRKLYGLLLLGRALATPARGAQTSAHRVFFIGNSVTDTIRYEALAQWMAGRDTRMDRWVFAVEFRL